MPRGYEESEVKSLLRFVREVFRELVAGL
ncbi:MAG: hypothetical protein QW057_07315 [Candidatus Bathyarchaeia archaeon]